MQERLKYKNHLNETIDFGEAGIYVSASDLHDYGWTVSQKNNKISSFKRSVTTRTLPVTIFCRSAKDGIAARNRLMEVAEKDILAKKPGRIIIGDYYYKCYITASKKARYLTCKQLMEASLTVLSDKPCWVKETKHSFRKASGSAEGLDYPFDYGLDFTSDFNSTTLINADFTASNFRMIIYGACNSPAVHVAGHPYCVNCPAADGEYITIDSVAKTVTKTAADGTVANIFNLRCRENYIFEKIPAGDSLVTWDGDFGVDIILMEERSEPKWT